MTVLNRPVGARTKFYYIFECFVLDLLLSLCILFIQKSVLLYKFSNNCKVRFILVK